MMDFFTLTAFNNSVNHRAVVFSLSLVCYSLIVFLNVSLIAIIALNQSLHEPMYILLCVCCVNILYGTTGFYPRFLSDLLSPSQVISYGECLCQSFVLYSYVCSDTSILAVMAYDRYLAICQPLRYHAIMTKRRLLGLVCFSLATPFCIFSFNILLTARLKFCGNKIQRLFCLNWVIVRLACPGTSTTINNIYAMATLSVYILHWLFVLWTYVYMVRTCLCSKEDRAKFMQTCVPHLISLITFFVIVLSDLLLMRMASEDTPQGFQNLIATSVVVVPPLMNPLLYGFKLAKIRKQIFVLIRLRKK